MDISRRPAAPSTSPVSSTPGAPPRTVADLLPSLLAADPAAPRIVWYDRTGGPGDGERIELSGRVLANWVAKAANALTEEFGVGPGSRVELDLPPHWRTAYWALAAWTLGAVIVDTDADVVITSDAQRGDADVLVTLTALARQAPVPVPAGVMDEAAELAGFADTPPTTSPAGLGTAAELGTVERPMTCSEWPAMSAPSVVAVAAPGSIGCFLDAAVGCWGRGGAIVLVALTGEADDAERATPSRSELAQSSTVRDIAAQESTTTVVTL